MSRTVTVSCPRCEGEVEMSVYRESYGADADGNRGESRDVAEVYDMPCECELSDSQHEQMAAAAVDARYAEEARFYEEPEEVEELAEVL